MEKNVKQEYTWTTEEPDCTPEANTTLQVNYTSLVKDKKEHSDSVIYKPLKDIYIFNGFDNYAADQ